MNSENCIELSKEIKLYLDFSNNKLVYIFKRNGKEFSRYYNGVEPSSLTNRMTIGQEVIKHLDPENALKKKVLNSLFDKFKEEAQELFEKIKEENKKKIEKDPNNFLKDTVQLLFENRKEIDQARRMLGELLGEDAGIILSKGFHSIYQLDKESNGYVEISVDDVKAIDANYVGEYNTNNKDIEIALTHIDERLTPKHNIVKFNNCLFDMGKLEPIESEEPIFTLIESEYNYNPKAKGKLVKDFLYSSLKRDSDEETEEEVQKILEIIGYLFTSGNKRTTLPIIVGIGGSGTSVLLNLIIKIFGVNKTADLKLQNMDTPHGTSSLLGKHLNVIRDSDDGIVENTGTLKQKTGYDDIQVDPKFQHPIVIDKDEVPKSILVANKIPRFRNVDSALLDRIIIIEFKHKFRGTKSENKNLLADILDNEEEMEWLIYNSIKAYEFMVNNSQDFLARKTHEETELLLNKHSQPLNFLVSELLTYDSDETGKSVDHVYTNELNKACVKLAEKEGLNIDYYIYGGKIKPKSLLNAIKNVFKIYDISYTTKVATESKTSERYYPCVYKIKRKWKGLI